MRLFLRGVLALILLAGGVPAARSADPSASPRGGLVFVEGRFVAGPYHLETLVGDNAIEIVVAGATLDRIAFADAAVDEATGAGRRANEQEPPGYEIPEGCDRLRGSGFPLYLNRLLDYHRGRTSEEEALALVEAVASRSPLVDRLERTGAGFSIFDEEGDPYLVGLGKDLVRPRATREEARLRAARTMEVYRKILREKGAILHFRNADVFLPRARVEDLLIPSLEILGDRRWPAEEKRRRLDRLWRNDGLVAAMLLGYEADPRLERALRVYGNGGER